MCPKPMDTMLEKQTKEEALKKRADRSQMLIKDVPPTTPGTTHFMHFGLIFWTSDFVFQIFEGQPFSIELQMYKFLNFGNFTVAQVLAQKKKKKAAKKKRADPCCTVCKKQMKGHQFVKDCPTNKQLRKRIV